MKPSGASKNAPPVFPAGTGKAENSENKATGQWQDTSLHSDKQIPDPKYPDPAQDSATSLHQRSFQERERQTRKNTEKNPQTGQSEPANSSPASQSGRQIKPNDTEQRGWLKWLKPSAWVRKPTSERSVTQPRIVKSPVNLVNRCIIGAAKLFKLDSLVKGLQIKDIHNTLSGLSCVYRQWAARQPIAAEVITIPELTLNPSSPESAINLKDVQLRIRKARPVGGKADPFSKLRVVVDIAANARYTRNGTTFVGHVNLPDMMVDLSFQKGDLIQHILKKGTVASILLSPSVRHFLNYQACLTPTAVHIQSKARNCAFQLMAEDNPKCCASVSINKGRLGVTLVPGTSASTPLEYSVTGKNLDVSVSGHQLETFFPAPAKNVLCRLFPHTSYTSSEARLQAPALQLRGSLHQADLDCPELTINSTGDLAFTDTDIHGLNAHMRQQGAHGFEIAGGFEALEGDLHLDHSTLYVPFDETGKVRLGATHVGYQSKPGQVGDLQPEIQARIKQINAEVDGGVTFNGQLDKFRVNYDLKKQALDLGAERITGENADVYAEPTGKVPEKRIIKLKGEVTGFDLSTAVNPSTGEPTTDIHLGKVSARELQGLATANTAELEKVRVSVVARPNNKVAISGGAENIQAQKLTVLPDAINPHVQLELSSDGDMQATPLAQQLDFQTELTLSQDPQEGITHTAIDVQLQDAQGQFQAHRPASRNIPLAGAGTVAAPQASVEVELGQSGKMKHLNARLTAHAQVESGSATGSVNTTGMAIDYQQDSGDGQDYTLSCNARQLAAGHIRLNPELSPKGLQSETTFTLSGPAVIHTVSSLSAEPGQQSEHSPEQRQTKTRTQLSTDSSSLSTVLELDTGDVGSPVTREQLEALSSYLPESQKQQVEPMFQHLLDNAELVTPAVPEKLQQSVQFNTQACHGEQVSTGTLTETDVEIEAPAVELKNGALQASASADKVYFQRSDKGAESDIRLETDRATVQTLNTTSHSPLPVDLELTEAMSVEGLKLRRKVSPGTQAVHGAVRHAALSASVGLKGQVIDAATGQSRQLKPAHVNLELTRASITRHQQGDDDTLTTVSAAELSLAASDTREQIGSDIRAHLRCSEQIVNIHTQLQQVQIDAEVDQLQASLSGELNGELKLRRSGISLLRDDSGIKLNSRLNNKHASLVLKDPVREILNILQSKFIKDSALGQACDLKIISRIDPKTNSGTISVTIQGVVSPILKLLLSITASRPQRLLIKMMEALFGRFNFSISLVDLPVTNGMANPPDLVTHTYIAVRSLHGRFSRIMASGAEALLNIVFPKASQLIISKFRMTDSQTGQISFEHLAQYLRKNITMVDREQIQPPSLLSSGDNLEDMHKILLLGCQLPEEWNQSGYLLSLQQRILSMRFNGKRLAQSDDHMNGTLLQFCSRLAEDYQRPQNIGDFRRLEDMLDILQQQLHQASPPLDIYAVYQLSQQQLAQQAITRPAYLSAEELPGDGLPQITRPSVQLNSGPLAVTPERPLASRESALNAIKSVQKQMYQWRILLASSAHPKKEKATSALNKLRDELTPDIRKEIRHYEQQATLSNATKLQSRLNKLYLRFNRQVYKILQVTGQPELASICMIR